MSTKRSSASTASTCESTMHETVPFQFPNDDDDSDCYYLPASSCQMAHINPEEHQYLDDTERLEVEAQVLSLQQNLPLEISFPTVSCQEDRQSLENERLEIEEQPRLLQQSFPLEISIPTVSSNEEQKRLKIERLLAEDQARQEQLQCSQEICIHASSIDGAKLCV